MCIGAFFSDDYKFETLSLSLTGRGTYKDYQEYDILEISGGVDYSSYLKLYNTYFLMNVKKKVIFFKKKSCALIS